MSRDLLFLSKVEHTAVRAAPYPHVLLERAVDEELALRLAREFPPLTSFTQGHPHPANYKRQRRNADLLADPAVSETWKAIIRAHLERPAYEEVVRLFGDLILKEYPDFERRFGRLSELKLGVRGRDSYDRHDALLDAGLVIHSPVTDAARFERGAHLKLSDKIVELQVYFRADGDSAPGGEIEIFEPRPGFTPPLYGQNETDPAYLRLARSVRYDRGTLSLSMMTPRSFGQLALRGPGRHPTQYFFFNVQLKEPLFWQPYHPFRGPGG